MRKQLIVIGIGVAVLAGFAIWGLQTTGKAKETSGPGEELSPSPAKSPQEVDTIVTQAIEEQEVEVTQANPEKPTLEELKAYMNTMPQQADYGDVEGAVRNYKQAANHDDRINQLANLAYQPEGSRDIHMALLEAIQDEDEEIRAVASETILNYEDSSLWPALNALAENPKTPLDIRKLAKDTAELIHPDVRSYREVAARPENYPLMPVEDQAQSEPGK